MAERKGFEPLWAKDSNGFQDRPVMTASVPLHMYLIFKFSLFSYKSNQMASVSF